MIGEAVKNVPVEIRRQDASIPWRKMAGLRDIVIHEYFGVDDDVVWDVVRNRIPHLLEQVAVLLTNLQRKDA